MGVFLTTAVFCIFAYVWLYITLAVWSPDEIELAEAILTLVFFLLLVVLAFSADKYNAYKKNKLEKELLGKVSKRKTLSKDDFYRIIGIQQKNMKQDPRIRNNSEYKSLKSGEKDMENQGSNPEFVKTEVDLNDLNENGGITGANSIRPVEKNEKNNDFSEMMKEVKKDKDCLLYTSPSPRDLSTSRMPSSA